jgi:hypothetical protein
MSNGEKLDPTFRTIAHPGLSGMHSLPMPGNGDKLTMLGNGEWDLYYFLNASHQGQRRQLNHAGQRGVGLVLFFECQPSGATETS